MPVLTELDLNAPIENYCLTIVGRCRNNGFGCGEKNVPNKISPNYGHPDFISDQFSQIITQSVRDVFQEKMKVVSSQKERFSPHLFKIIEKTHFENLLPFAPNRATMPYQEANDIFIEYAEEFHRLGQATERIDTRMNGLEQDVHYQLDTTYTHFMRGLDEVKEYGAETRHLVESQKKYIQMECDEAIEDALDEMEKYIRECDKRFTYIDNVISDSMYYTMDIHTRCDHLAQEIKGVIQDIKDIQVLTTKRMNQLETKIAGQISNTFTTIFILLGFFLVIQYVLSVNPVSKIPSVFPLLPGA